jgi:hypothetical protein
VHRNGLSTADVDDGTALGLRLDLPQDLVGDRGGVPLPEEDVAEAVSEKTLEAPSIGE